MGTHPHYVILTSDCCTRMFVIYDRLLQMFPGVHRLGVLVSSLCGGDGDLDGGEGEAYAMPCMT